MELEKRLDKLMDNLAFIVAGLVVLITLPIWILPHLKHKKII
jgi:hypothetical protein